MILFSATTYLPHGFLRVAAGDHQVADRVVGRDPVDDLASRSSFHFTISDEMNIEV